MKRLTFAKKLFALFLTAVFAVILLSGCGTGDKEAITSFSQLAQPGIKIGVSFDIVEYDLLKKDYPDAEIIPYSDSHLAYEDVANGRIDAYIYARLEMETAIKNGVRGVRLLDENYSSNTIVVGISPKSSIADLRAEFNSFIDAIRADGTLDDMYNRWVVLENGVMPEIKKAENPTCKLKVGTTGTVMPYSYYIGTDLSGYDIELANRFAEWLNADIEFKVYDFGGIVAAAAVGDVDCVMSNLYLTQEISESIECSDPLFKVEMTAMVRDTGKTTPMVYAAEYSDFSDLAGKTVSMLTGAPFEELVLSKVPNVGKFTFFNNNPDMVFALKTGKTDAFLINNAVATLAVNRNTDLAMFPKDLQTGAFGFAFAKGSPERDVWQTAYDSIPEETKLDLWEKWTGSDDSIKILPEQNWRGANGTVQAAVCDTLEPMSYMDDGGRFVGFDIEMILLIAEKLDVHVEFIGMEFSSVMSEVQSGKALIGAGSIIATDERRESVDFIDYYPAAFSLVVRSVPVEANTSKTLEDMYRADIGVLTGSNFPEHVNHALPEAKLLYYNTLADEINALKKGKISAVALDEPVARNIMAQDSSVTMISQILEPLDYGFIFCKSDRGEKLRNQLNEFILKIKSDGTMESLQKKWFDNISVSSSDMLDYRQLPDINGKISLTTIQNPPFSFIIDELQCGYDIELFALFCRENGYALDVTDVSMDAVIPSIQSEKFDAACCGISITEERKESVLFSEPNYSGGTVLLVLKELEEKNGTDFFSSIKDSFEKTFIRENRWKLFLSGIGTTVLITVLSVLLGTLLGFLVFMICRKGNKAANVITRFCIWLIHGMPVVVLLMILYYVVFGKVAVSGTIVSIIGFTLIFGAAVFGMLKSGVGAVDHGQTEAAYALGYTDRRAFYRVILPQALPHFMPAYKGEITSLIKATAVVGYVTVQDLTKMGDIIRSRTYEAFFPLIAVAVIYFILAAILNFIVNKAMINIDPRRRSRKNILKGVDGK
ncbi:MAG: transporter substrate-binding domain-containing protein [Clostridia bacterium]|nr:transporter substrate-binding domain-containing protein [Clostridia bacterium]